MLQRKRRRRSFAFTRAEKKNAVVGKTSIVGFAVFFRWRRLKPTLLSQRHRPLFGSRQYSRKLTSIGTRTGTAFPSKFTAGLNFQVFTSFTASESS